MTEQHRTVALERDVPRIQSWLNAVVKQAFHHAAEAERIIEDIRRWVAHERHLIDTCTTPDCGDCATRESLLTSLASLLPASPERRADSGGEVTGMAGTRVTRDRDLAIGGEESDKAAVRGDDDDRDL